MPMIVKNSIYLLCERFLNTASSFITFALAANLSSTNNFGLFTYNIAIYSILLPLIIFGMNGLLVKYFLDNQNEKIILANSLAIRAASFMFVASGLAIFSLIDADFSLIILIALFGNIFQLFESYNQAHHRNFITMYVRLFVTVVFVSIKFIFYIKEISDINLLLCLFAFELLFFFLIGFFISLNVTNLFASLSKKKSIEIMSGGSLLLASGFAEIVNLRIDQIMIGKMLSLSEAGMYAIAARLVEFPVIFAAVIAAASFPKIYKSINLENDFYSNLRKLNLAIFFFASFFIGFLYIFGEQIINIFFGDEYKGASKYLFLLLPCLYPLFFRIVISKWIIAKNILWLSLASHILGAIVNVFLNFLLIPKLGIDGAVIASILSYCVSCWAVLFVTTTTREYILNAYIN